MAETTTTGRRAARRCSKHAYAPPANFRPSNSLPADVTFPAQRRFSGVQTADVASEYAVAGDNPANQVDPLGLWGWNPISDVTQAAGDAGHFVAQHHQVIEQIATVAAAATLLAVCAGATGGACLAVTAFSPVIGGLVGDAVYAEGGGPHTGEGYAMAFGVGGAVGAGSLVWGGVAVATGALWAGNLAIGGAVSAYQYSKSPGCHSFGGYVQNTISGAAQNAPLNFHGIFGGGDE